MLTHVWLLVCAYRARPGTPPLNKMGCKGCVEVFFKKVLEAFVSILSFMCMCARDKRHQSIGSVSQYIAFQPACASTCWCGPQEIGVLSQCYHRC